MAKPHLNASALSSIDGGPIPESPVSPAPSAADFLVKRYTPDCRREWDRFVSTGKNATFLFHRDYMEYHNDRFADYSLMVYCGNKLMALLPANLNPDGAVVSHEGLTYGGLVARRAATLLDVLACFHALLRYLHRQAISRLRYKKLPGFYNTIPDDEVTYALFLLEAGLYRRDCAMVVPQADRFRFQRRRRREIKKAARFGVRVEQETNFLSFWEPLLATRLTNRYGVKPVHTLEEITLLASRFPDQIKQYSAYREDRVVAGATIFETPTVAHAQYSAVSDEGAEIGALDFLFAWLIEERYKDKRYFDFGICNESGGRVLNQGLLEWKEGFGGRCHAHDFYLIATENYTKLEAVLRGETGAHCG